MTSTTNSASDESVRLKRRMSEVSSSLSPPPSDYLMEESSSASTEPGRSNTKDVGSGSPENANSQPPQAEALRSHRIKPFSSGKPWSEKEDELLCRLGDEKVPFPIISERLPGRSQYACNARYRDVLGWTREKWTESEEQTLIKMCQSGASYQQVADKLPGRSSTQCRYRWGHHKAVARQEMSKQDYAMFMSRGGRNRKGDAGPRSKAQNCYASRRIDRTDAWTSHEKNTLLSHRARGEAFTEISMHLPGRTSNACKRYYFRLQHSITSRPDRKAIKRAKRLKLVSKPRNQTWLEDEESDILHERRLEIDAESLASDSSDDAETERPGMDIDDDNDEPAAGSKNVHRHHHEVIILSSDEDSDPDQQPIKAHHNRPWTDLDLKTLGNLRAKGKGWDEISKHFTGRTPAACELRYAWYRHVKNAGRRKALSSQKPAVRVWRPEDEGVDLLTGLPCDAQVSRVLSTPANREGDNMAISNMDTETDSNRSEYYSVASHNPRSKGPSILNTDAKNTSQDPISPTTEDANSCARLAQRVLHQHLVKRGEQKLPQDTDTVQQHSRPRPQAPQPISSHNDLFTEQLKSASARYDALEELRRTHPPLARRAHDSSPSSPMSGTRSTPSVNLIALSENSKIGARIGASSTYTSIAPSPRNSYVPSTPTSTSSGWPDEPSITKDSTPHKDTDAPEPVSDAIFDPALPTSHYAPEEPQSDVSSTENEAVSAEDDVQSEKEEEKEEEEEESSESESEDVKGFLERWGIR